MSIWLKQSTSTTIQFGPFLDKTDGVALEVGLATALDNATTGIRLTKNGATQVDRNSATAPAYTAMGLYTVVLDATDTNTLGNLRIIFEEAATCLPVWQDFMVVPANVWDSLFGADLLDVNLTQISGAAVSTSTAQLGVNAVQAGATAWGSGAITAGSIATNAIAATKIATGAITSAKFAASAINAAAIATDAIAGAKVAADAVTKIQAGLATPTNITAGTIATVTNLTNLPTIPANWITAAGIAADAIGASELAADAVTEIQAGLATEASIQNIGTSGGAAINVDSAADNQAGGIAGVTSATTKLGTQTGTLTNTSSVDDSYHVITHATNEIDWVYQFLTGGGSAPVGVRWVGYLVSSNDTMTIYAWNHVGAAWETIGTQGGSSGSVDVTRNLILFARHRGTSAAELGKVYIRIKSTGSTSPVLSTNQIFVSYSVTSRTVGYANGAVWLDTLNGTAGTESFVNGTADKPSNTLANALTIATALGLKRIEVAAGSSITLASSFLNYDIRGENYSLVFGGQTITGAKITGATVAGVYLGSTAVLEHCIINGITGPGMTMRNCYFNDVTITNNGTAGWFMTDCRSRVAGSGAPNFDFGAAVNASDLSLRGYYGGIELENMGTGTGTYNASIEGHGHIIYNANCSATSNISLRGIWQETDNAGGAITVTYDDIRNNISAALADTNELQTDWVDGGRLDVILDAASAPSAASVADAVWDELLSGHVVGGSSGEALSAAGTAGDPWVTALPGAYGAGTAGQIVGDNINATVSSRMAEASINTTGGAVDNVTLVATTTTNTDMRGTDSAATAANLATAQADLDIITGASGVNLLTATQASIDAIEADTNELQVDDIPTALATVDTNVDAIKAKTDDLTFTVANQVDVNAQYWNDVIIATSLETAANVSDAVWDELLSGHVVSGSSGEALAAAGTAGDPWVTALPGGYGAGTAGNIVGNNLDVASSSLATAANLATAQADLDIITGASGVNLLTATQASIDAIEADTSELQTDDIPTTLATLATSANLATVDAIVDDLKSGLILGAAVTGTLSVTQMTTDLTGYTDDQLIGRLITFLSGAADGEQTNITDYASTNGLLSFAALTVAPANTDTFKIT